MIWNQFCDINISVFIADFTNFQNNKSRDAEVNKIPNDIEIHDFTLF